MRFRCQRLDSQFWIFLVCALSLLGAVGCFAIAARAQSNAKDVTEIVSVSAVLRQMESAPSMPRPGPILAEAEAVR